MSQPSYASRWPSGNATSSSGVMAGPRLSITSSTTTAVCRARLDRPRATALPGLRAEGEDVPPDGGSTLLVPRTSCTARHLARQTVRTAISAYAGLVATMRTPGDNGRLRLPAGAAVNAVEAAAIGVTLQLICANCACSDPAVATCATPSSDQPSPTQTPASPQLAAAATQLRGEFPNGPTATLRASRMHNFTTGPTLSSTPFPGGKPT